MPAAVGTTTFGSYTLANPETEEWLEEWEPDESTKIMLDGACRSGAPASAASFIT